MPTTQLMPTGLPGRRYGSFSGKSGVAPTIPKFVSQYAQQRIEDVLYLRQSTASQTVLIGPYLDSTDGVTPETGLTIANTDIRLSANGGNMAAKNSGGGTHDELGMYQITLDATDTATVGKLQLVSAVSGAIPIQHVFIVLEEAVYDQSLAAGADGVIDSNLVEIGGSTSNIVNLNEALQTSIRVEAASGSTTTLVAESIAPASTEDDQFIGRKMYFLDDTVTEELRGQSATILDFVHSTQTFTLSTLTEAVADGDTAYIGG